MADKTNNIIYRIEVDSVSGKLNIDGVTKSFEDADKAVLKLQSDLKKGTQGATKEMNQLRSASGGATTSVLELGRVVSDAPYGIRGMANNVSQLASNMLFTSQQIDKTTGKVIGLGGVLKDMGKVFMGPLGLLFLIQGAIALLDGFAGGATKAKKSTQELTKEVYANGLVMRGYVDELEDVNTSEERRKVVVQELTEAIPTLTATELEYGKNLDNVRLKIKQYTLAQAARIEMDKLVQENSKLLSQQMRVDLINSTEDQEEKIKLIKGLLVDSGIETEKLVQQSYSMGQKSMTLRDKTNKELIADFKELAKGIKEESDPIMERIERLSQGLAFDPNKTKGKGKGKGKKRPEAEYFDFKGLKEGQGKLLAEIIKTNEKTALLSVKDKKSRLIIQRDFHLRRLMAAHGANSEIVKAYKKYYKQLIDTAEQGELELLAKEGAEGMGVLKRNTTTDAEIIKDQQRLLTQVKLEALMESSQAISSFMDGEFQREITMEQNKTNAINNELRERLNNENLSVGERKSIQLKIARNDEVLRKKQEIIEKKRFKMQKAANISQALISTYLAAAQVQANPMLLDPVTKAISMAATIATGLANVATISRQKFQSSAGATSTAGALGAGGSGGGNDRSFNFNLAGASRENQLAQTLQGRFDQPLQAYVVSRDITNQQQLDEDIRNNASFG